MKEQPSNVEAVQAENWRHAQSLSLSAGRPLVAAALQLLEFLERVDRHRCLYQAGPVLSRAIERYEECWLPLLAEYGRDFLIGSFPLQPPLDCAWIWHCHRLNPIVYARDCQHIYGRILGAPPTMNSAEAIEYSRSLWEKRFTKEKYHLDLTQFQHFDQGQTSTSAPLQRASKIQYNLEDALMRQNTFYYQVSQPHMKEESFLRAAEQRYKGFLHLFKLTNMKDFLVPTYDIDLMWHTHQLHPKAYTKDLTHILGRVLEHDDTDSDRSPGQRLQEGFHRTCQRWQESYGMVYQRAGAMYRGEAPAPVELSLPSPSVSSTTNKPTTAVGLPIDFTAITPRELMQVFITVIRARNLPKKHGKFVVRLQMERKCRSFKLETASIPWVSDLVWNHSWTFEAEKSTNSLRLLLLRKHRSRLEQKIVGSDVLGEAYLPWQTLLSTPTFSYDGWLRMSPTSARVNGATTEKCPSLLVSVSLTPPQPAPELYRTINCIPTDDCRRMIETTGTTKGCWLTRTVLDHTNRVVFVIRSSYAKGKLQVPENQRCFHIHQGEWEYANIYTNVGTAPARIVATAKQLTTGWDRYSMQRRWGFFYNTSQLLVRRPVGDPLWDIRPYLEIQGSLSNQIRLVRGRKLDYEVRGASAEDEGGFVTLIRYSADAPVGKSTALLNWQAGVMEVSPGESIILVLLLSNIISTTMFDMEGLKVKRRGRQQAPARQATPSDEWGAVVLTSRSGASMISRRDAMMPYYCWWDMSPIIWATDFYGAGNYGLIGASGCGASGGCACRGAGGGCACGGAGGASGGCACGGAGGCGGGGDISFLLM